MSDQGTDSRRRLLLDILQDALTAVDGRRCIRAALAAGDKTKAVFIAAIGKAASSMTLGAFDALGDSIQSALVITKDDHVLPELMQRQGVTVFETSHPVPDERSLAAGDALLKWLDAVPQDAALVFLISGGSSSLVDVLVKGFSLQDLRRLNTGGLASGISIDALNARRREVSLIKGGKLASRLQGRRARAFYISDVPDDDPAVIGSGLMGPADFGKDRVERIVIASVDDAVRAAAESGLRRGLRVRTDSTRFADDAERLAVRFTHELHLQSVQLMVWGGESVTQLPATPGRGGRNQHLALAAARQIAGHEELMLLSVGTDGTDGPTPDAGALVDGNTCARLMLDNLDIDDCLRRADAGTALAASGDLIHTGPTGTNVGDLVIGLKLRRTAAP